MISDLYFSRIRYYPHWIQHAHNRWAVPDEISEAVECKPETKDVDEVVEITLFDIKYKFEFGSRILSLPDGDSSQHGKLTLYQNDKKVLTLNCSLDANIIDSEWRPFGIEAYIEGNWIECFEKLKRISQTNWEKREIQDAENPELVRKMKNDFGIK